MIEYVDSNIVLRYLMGTPAGLAARARALIDRGTPLWLTSVSLLEVYFALRNDYDVERETILDYLTEFVLRRNIETADAEKIHIVAAFDFCRGSGRVNCGDALIWAAVRSRGSART